MTTESVFINGTVGVGKSTVASQLSHLLRSSGRPHAVIDLDNVRRSWPSPENDPFNHARHADDGDGLDWHLRRAGELEAILRGADIDDCLLDASTAPPGELATKLRDAVGWQTS